MELRPAAGRPEERRRQSLHPRRQAVL